MLAGPPDARAPLAETTAPLPEGSGTVASSLALDATAAAPPASAATIRLPADAPANPPEPAEPPERLGRFLVLREVGRGAMGVVYAAYDDQLDRRVALKLVEFAGATDDSSRNLLLREAQALARLAHPNVVAVHEAGVHHDAVYLAMEFVAGVDLQRWLAAARRPWREVVGVFLQAGEGLLAAHKVGLVHRDFKPTNVLVGADGRVRVADFGLAARRHDLFEPVPEDSHMIESDARGRLLAGTIAAPGSLVGTPAYMALEQLLRRSATPASDQFAFCVALHEALYGRRPFTGATVEALTADVLTRDLPPASPDPAVPAWLYALVRRGLARDPGDRFPDMAALLRELARDPDGERARRLQRLRQLAVAVVVTLLVVLGATALVRVIARAADERRADERLGILRSQLAEMRAAGRHGEAARAFGAFVDLPENRGTAALARAYREWADVQTDRAAALDALAGAYLHARDPEAQLAVLRDLALRLAERGSLAATSVALDTLDARAPADTADTALAGARLAVALGLRDVPAARDALARLPDGDPRRGYDPVLEHLSRATEIPCARVGQRPGEHAWLSLDDYEGDGRPEIVGLAPARGDDVVLVLRTDPALTEVAALRAPVTDVSDGRTDVGSTIHHPRILPASMAGAPRLFVATRNPERDPHAQQLHHIVPLTPGAAPEFSWADSHSYDAAVVDLDRDGAAELYVGHLAYSRRLSRVTHGPDGWRRDAAHPATDRTVSDVYGLEAGDLDGDGLPELVVAVGPWNAFDVRVFRADDRGELRLVARKTLGHVSSLALPRAGAGRRIAATKRDDFPSSRRFGPDRPAGEPAGLYVLELDRDALAVHQFFPARAGDAPPHDFDWVRAGDLDGDGRDDLAAEDGDDLALLRGGDDGFLAPLRLADARPLLVADLDDDPAAELLVRRRDDPASYLALGLGDAPVPALPRPQLTARPIADGVADPAIAEAWRRAEDLAAIGLPLRAAAELADIAGLSGHVQEDILFRSGQLHTAAGDHAAAADAFAAAAGRPDLADAALAGAIASLRALRAFADAAPLAARRAALPGLAPAARAEAEAERDALRRVGGALPELSLRFDRPLDPAWRIPDPLALSREPGYLSLKTSANRLLAELPLEWDGGSVAITVEAEIVHADWGAQLSVALTPAGDDDTWLALSFGAGGLSENPVGQVRALTGALDTTRSFWQDLPPGPSGRLRFHFRHDPELGAGLVELERPDGQRARVLFPNATGTLPTAPAPGPLRLALLAHPVDPQLTAHLRIHAIDLLGVRLGAAPTAPDPDAALRHHLVEGELAEVLAGLADRDGERALWRAHALAHVDRIDEAAALLRSASAAPELRPHVLQLAQHDDLAVQLALRRALGPALDDLRLSSLQLYVPWHPERVGRLLDDLAAHPLEMPATPGLDQPHCAALILRGFSWHRTGRLDLARRDLEAAWRVLDDPARDLPRRVELRKKVLSSLIDIAGAARDRAAARRWLGIQLDETPAPDLLLEMARLRGDLETLLAPADWDALAARARP